MNADADASDATAAHPNCRKFSFGDLSISVAAVALCLALARVLLPFFSVGLSGVPFDKISGLADWYEYLARQPEVAYGLALYGSLGLIVFLMVWSMAFMLMRIRRPRPPLARVVLQPGMVAVEAVFAGIAFTVGAAVLRLPALFGIVGLVSAIPLAWSALALTGRWRSEPGWIDRLGRGLGLCWCLLIPTYVGLVMVVIKPRLW